MGYRHRSSIHRAGLAGVEGPSWELRMPQAECFMYFVAHLHGLFSTGFSLYVEGRGLADDVLELYRSHPAPRPQMVAPCSRHSATQRLHVALGPALRSAMNRLAARRTYAQMGESMLVYRGPEVWLDGRALGERLVYLHGSLPERDVRRFAGGPLRADVLRVEP